MAAPAPMPSARQDASQFPVSFGDSLRNASDAAFNAEPSMQNKQTADNASTQAAHSSADSVAQLSDLHSRYASRNDSEKQDAASSKSSNNHKSKSSDDDSDSKQAATTDASNSQLVAAVVVPVIQPLPTPQAYSLDPQSLTASTGVEGNSTSQKTFDVQDATADATAKAVQPTTDLKNSAVEDAANNDSDAKQNDVNAALQAGAQTQPVADPTSTPAAHKADAAQAVDPTQPAQPSVDAAAAQAQVIPQVQIAAQANAAVPVNLHAVSPVQASAAANKMQQVAGVNSKSTNKPFGKDSTASKSNSDDSDSTIQSDALSTSDVKASSGQQQNSHNGASQDQNANPAPVALDNHMSNMTAHRQDAFTDVSSQSAASSSNTASEQVASSKDRDVVPAQTPAPDAQPVINTAKLIQSMGQSEMRVGMRSAEFGDISIRTLSTHDTLTAQISLDHADLAKALATHLPEMHAKLGGDQNVEVRVNSNGQNSSFNGSGSSSNSDARGNGRQQGNNTYNTSRNFGTDQTEVAPAMVSASTNLNGSTGRLDIRA